MEGRRVWSRLAFFAAVMVAIGPRGAMGVMERDGYPWNVVLNSVYDRELTQACPDGNWFLNLGPTGIRARIYPERPDLLVVKYVFQDALSPAKGKVAIGDVIVGANGRKFTTPHRFGRGLPGGGGWDGPMMELAAHIEDSQASKDGVLRLIIWPKANAGKEREVGIQLRKVGRFSPTCPYDCPRSKQMLTELCDFLASNYMSDDEKGAMMFKGMSYGGGHALLALMASGNPKYAPIINHEIEKYASNRFDPHGDGFQTWSWGYSGIVLGEYYLLTKDTRVIPAMKSIADVMPLGCHAGNGIYTHRSYATITRQGAKPYASIAAISGLNMLAMSLFKKAGLSYDEDLYQRIHQHYLNSTSPMAVDIAYCFGNADKFNPPAIHPTHAIIKVKDPSKGLSGRGPGYVCPTGMKGIGAYEIVWPTPAEPDAKPTDWVAAEAATNMVTELSEPGLRQIDRRHPLYREVPEPTQPFQTSRSGGHLAPVGIGALAHLIGNDDRPSWQFLGVHAANTCALGPGNAFDGHAASNMHAFWSILAAARSASPAVRQAYFNYMKTFLILAETHNGGLILQPWGRDRPNCNSDVYYGPRTLPTATGAIMLALGERRLQITGAGLPSPVPSGTSPRRIPRKGTGSPKVPDQPDVPASPVQDVHLATDMPPMLDVPESTALPELVMQDEEGMLRLAPEPKSPPMPRIKIPPLPPLPPRSDSEEESLLDGTLRDAQEAGGQATGDMKDEEAPLGKSS
jgi:hypothetical protein